MCSVKILPNTYKKTGGYCIPCFQINNKDTSPRGQNRQSASQPKNGEADLSGKGESVEDKKPYKIGSVIACAAFIAAIGYAFSASTLQEKALLAVRGMLLVISVYKLFHCWVYFRTGKAEFKGDVTEKRKDKVGFFVILFLNLFLVSLMLTVFYLLST